ncbi:MAG: methionine biosynthesis protein MetW [Dehalococcoidales bacterium]|nr:methionine biosynthesis protein MetW [Dehalococcoidales bacterium]
MKYSLEKIETIAIAEIVMPKSSVLDLGCGDGTLLSVLVKDKKCRVQGIDIDEQAIYKCVARGLSVMHGDIDTGLSEYGDNSFDYVILNQSFQQVKKPDVVLKEALRVGKEVIVSFPNFAHISARTQIFFTGKTPVTPSLPFAWYNTPNLHFLSISDFQMFCRKSNIQVSRSVFLGSRHRVRFFQNLLALTGIFVISNQGRE